MDTARRPARLITPTVAPNVTALRMLRGRRGATCAEATGSSLAPCSGCDGSAAAETVGTEPVVRKARDARSKASTSSSFPETGYGASSGEAEGSIGSGASSASTSSMVSSRFSAATGTAGTSAMIGSGLAAVKGSISASAATSSGAWRWRAARRERGATAARAIAVDSAAEMGAVGPAAGASEAAVRSRLDRRVGAEAAWEFSKGKTFLSVVRQARGRKL